MNFTRKYYISIFGVTDATYKLYASIENRKFIILNNGIP
jgi:hypothetical protein